MQNGPPATEAPGKAKLLRMSGGQVALAVLVLALAVIRLQRPDGTWIAARGRRFDVTFGVVLGLGLLALASYANLPPIL